jgi:hypothetical protein
MATEAEKKAKRSAAGKKAAETRRANRIAAERREQETNSTTNWNWLPWALLVLFILGMLLWRPWTSKAAAPAPVVPTEALSLLPTAVVPVNPTEVPVVVADPTEIPVIEPTQVPVPVAVSCDTPSIKAFAVLNDKTMTAEGEYLDTNLGRRMTFTSRRLLIEKEWNVALSAEELKTVETTWQKVQVCVPEGLTAVIFTGGFEQDVDRYETGALLSLKTGLYEFNMRNGEVVIWYPGQETFAQDDLNRIVEQIKFGNFDIHSELAFFGVTSDILPKIPAELVKELNVQIIPFADPVVK